ncbi:MAG: serine/threonine-protein kinase [Gemmatimonadales bacterium]
MTTPAALSALLAAEYRIERELGRGGMGVVYLARDIRLDRDVAIKVLPPALGGTTEFRARFLREARTAAQLSHPNIVPVYRADEIGSYVLFVMAYVEGESLAERIRRVGILSPQETVRILREAAWALAYAHARGVVHRDVKPENLMIEKGTGRVVVTDFGIARDVRAEPLTRDGEVLGSVHYMSPEQVAGESVDGRTDVYALGVIGYQCLAGRVPFDAALASAVLLQQATQPPPSLRDSAPDVPAPLAAVIDRCLEKRPADRFPTSEALADALAAALEGVARADNDIREARQLSEGEARAIWQRAAELQAEAATRIRTANRTGEGLVAAGPETGFRVRDVEQAAIEAGIAAEFVAIAMAERQDAASVDAAESTAREERLWTSMLGTEQRSLSVVRTVSGTPRQVLDAIGRTFPQTPFRLTLRDTIGGHPLDGGVLIFDIPRQLVQDGGVSMFAYRMTQIELHQIQVTLRSLAAGGTEVRLLGDLRPGLRKNWVTDKWMAGIATALGGAGGTAVGAGALGLGLLAAGPAVLGAGLLGGTALAWYRWAYRAALSKAAEELGRMIDRVAGDLRAAAVFGETGRIPLPPRRGPGHEPPRQG